MRKRIIFGMLLILLISILSGSVFGQLSDSKVIIISLVNQDPDPAIAGDVVELRLGVENKGGNPSYNMILELVPEYPFTLVSGEEAVKEVGTISSYQYGDNMKIVKYKVRADRDASAGAYELKIKQYEEGNEKSYSTKSLNIDIKNKESAEVIHIDKTTLVPGKETSLKFTINNVGNAPLRDLSFYWLNEDKVILPVGSDNTKYIKYVDIGESAVLEYKVIADSNADPGLYELSLNLKYDNPITEGETEVSTIAGIYVGGETDFSVAFSEISSGEYSFSVANIGSNPAYSVSVVVPKQTGWRVMGSNSVIIGNLNKGDYTVASFNLANAAARQNGEQTTERSSARESNIEIQIVYTDTQGERKSVTKKVEVNSMGGGPMDTSYIAARGGMGGRTQGGSNTWLWVIIVVVLAGGYIIYRKHKKMNPNLKISKFFRKKK